MVTLFIRTILIYLTVFAVIRLTGKRQLSNMQPFDLVVTLLIADVASAPISDSAIPFLYGVVPILALFLLHKTVSILTLKSDGMRRFFCGNPVLLIYNGSIIENSLRAADFTLDDLMEQLRLKDAFSISEVGCCILETNGSISVYKKQQTNGKSGSMPSILLISDGKVRREALESSNTTLKSLEKKLYSNLGAGSEQCLFACLEGDGSIHAQMKRKADRMRTHSVIIGV